MGDGLDPQRYLANNVSSSGSSGSGSEGGSQHRPQVSRPLEGAFLLLVCLMTLGGHALLCLTVLRYKTLHKAMYVLLLNLSTSDLMLGTLVMPVTSHSLLVGRWDLDERLCRVTGLIFTLCKYTSMTSLSALSLNRYVRVCRSVWYSRLYSKQLMVLHLAAVWLVPVLVNLPRISRWENFQYQPVSYQCEWVGQLPRLYFVVLALMPLLQWVLVIFCNTSIYIKYKKSRTVVASHRMKSQDVSGALLRQPGAQRGKPATPPRSAAQEGRWAAAAAAASHRDGVVPVWQRPRRPGRQEMALPESELRLQDVESKASLAAECSPLPSVDTACSSPPEGASSEQQLGTSTALGKDAGSEDVNANNQAPTASPARTAQQPTSARGHSTRSSSISKQRKPPHRQASCHSLASSKLSFFMGAGGLVRRQLTELQQQHQGSLSGGSRHVSASREEVRVLLVVALVVLLFFLAYIPLGLVSLLKSTTALHVPALLQLLCLMLLYVSSMCNPLIYGWGNNNVRNCCRLQLEDFLCVPFKRVSPG